jgi:predicted NAD/FAD-binding protein
VVLACHSDQSLALLADATPEERAVLGAIRYHPNRAVLHTDTAVLPRAARLGGLELRTRRRHGREQAAVCLHYLINRLQPLPWQQPVMVSLNPDPGAPARPAQRDRRVRLQPPGVRSRGHPRAAAPAGRSRAAVAPVWFCGAWTRYGFHEDGLMSALAVVQTAARAPGRERAAAWPQAACEGGQAAAGIGRGAPPPAAPGATTPSPTRPTS